MTYEKSGVDINAADKWVEGIQAGLTHDSKLISGVGEYAAVYAQNKDEWIATSCDGIGTKLLWSLDSLGSAESLAQDLLAMNVNDVLCTGATPKLFLDYIACSGSDALKEGSFLKSFIKGLIKVCGENDQLLVGGETAQMPELYKGNHFDVGGFSIGFLKPEAYLHPKNLKEGMSVWGWTSSGPHSNGYSWLRKIFSTSNDASYIQEHLMPATRVYVKDFFNLRKAFGPNDLISAYHITGSGLWNLLRSQDKIGFNLDQWPSLPAWALEVQKRTNASTQQLFETFNCGIGFAVVVSENTDVEVLKKQGLQYLGKTENKAGLRLPKYNIELKNS